jgi:nicotinamide-nucleotide amidase
MDPELLATATRVLDANRAAGRMVVTAESCTGGLVAAALTEIAGASDVVERGFVTYSNDAKLEAIGVNRDILETFGAVSIAVAWAMAQGALKHSHADTAVAVTGIAGPAGGSDKKPVGTVVFARATRDGDPDIVVADVRHFGDLGRSEIRRQAALVALELLMPDAPVPGATATAAAP